MTVGIIMTVWNIKTAHKRILLGTVITMPTVITLSLTLGKIYLMLSLYSKPEVGSSWRNWTRVGAWVIDGVANL